LTRAAAVGNLVSFNLDRRILGINLQQTSGLTRLLSDITRVRLLLLLEQEELSVAELAAITKLAQPRVSTHLARLKEAGLVCDRRAGVSVYYRFREPQPGSPTRLMWEAIRTGTDDPLTQQDAERIPQVLENRNGVNNWADAVAGDMERHYSPGRTWEATTRALVQLLDLGVVLDIASGDGVTAELLSPQARRLVCVDISERVVAAGSKRTGKLGNVDYEQADMHQLPMSDASFDTVLMLHALTYSRQPEAAVNEAARVLKPGGRLLAATLKQHKHAGEVAPYGHVNQGFNEAELRELTGNAGLDVVHIGLIARESRPPNFEVLGMLAELRAA